MLFMICFTWRQNINHLFVFFLCSQVRSRTSVTFQPVNGGLPDQTSSLGIYGSTQGPNLSSVRSAKGALLAPIIWLFTWRGMSPKANRQTRYRRLCWSNSTVTGAGRPRLYWPDATSAAVVDAKGPPPGLSPHSQGWVWSRESASATNRYQKRLFPNCNQSCMLRTGSRTAMMESDRWSGWCPSRPSHQD